MLMMLVLMLVGPETCTTVKQECRACTTNGGKQICSNIGIACQPSVRICRSKPSRVPSDRSKEVTTQRR